MRLVCQQTLLKDQVILFAQLFRSFNCFSVLPGELYDVLSHISSARVIPG